MVTILLSTMILQIVGRCWMQEGLEANTCPLEGRRKGYVCPTNATIFPKAEITLPWRLGVL
jgi:hypothetical protein